MPDALELGREREGIDLSKVKLTHHTLRSRGTAAMPLGVGEKPLLSPCDRGRQWERGVMGEGRE